MRVSSWISFAAIFCALSALAVEAKTTSSESKASKQQGMSMSDTQKTYKDIKDTLGIVPSFVRQFPEGGLAGAWEEAKAIEFSSNTKIPDNYKNLISLGVSVQIPCKNCTHWTREMAKANNVTQLEMNEAVAIAAITRHWSTYLNGMQLDEATFRKETDQIIGHFRQQMSKPGSKDEAQSKQQAGQVSLSDITTPQAAYQDIERTLGMVPQFLRNFPQEGIVGAWKEMKSVQLNPNTRIPPKYKELIGLSVAAQIPCHYCTYFHTQAAKLNGATDQEVREALAISAIDRHWSTVLNGSDISESNFQSEVRRIVQFMKQQRTSTPKQLGGAVPPQESTESQNSTEHSDSE